MWSGSGNMGQLQNPGICLCMSVHTVLYLESLWLNLSTPHHTKTSVSSYLQERLCVRGIPGHRRTVRRHRMSRARTTLRGHHSTDSRELWPAYNLTGRLRSLSLPLHLPTTAHQHQYDDHHHHYQVCALFWLCDTNSSAIKYTGKEIYSATATDFIILQKERHNHQQQSQITGMVASCNQSHVTVYKIQFLSTGTLPLHQSWAQFISRHIKQMQSIKYS